MLSHVHAHVFHVSEYHVNLCYAHHYTVAPIIYGLGMCVCVFTCLWRHNSQYVPKTLGRMFMQ